MEEVRGLSVAGSFVDEGWQELEGLPKRSGDVSTEDLSLCEGLPIPFTAADIHAGLTYVVLTTMHETRARVLQFLLGSVEHVRLSNHLEVAALGVQRRPVVAEPFCVARILVGDAVLTLVLEHGHRNASREAGSSSVLFWSWIHSTYKVQRSAHRRDHLVAGWSQRRAGRR